MDQSMNNKCIKLAIIGCGAWGPNHIRNFSSLPGCQVVGIADLNEARLKQMASANPGLKTETDYRRFLDHPEVDAVVVATPTSTHYQIVREALQAKKDVLCEKPLCTLASEGEELVRLARSQERILMVGNVFLFNSGIVKLKELVDSGDLGDLQYMSATRTNLGPIRRDVNAAFDLASHDISIFNWLMGREPTSVSAIGACLLQAGIEDVVNISLKYEPNILATILVSWLSPRKVRQITVVGRQKMVTWDDMELTTPVAIYEKGVKCTPEYSGYGEFLRISTWDGDVRLPKVVFEEPVKAQARYFLESVARREIARSGPQFSWGVVRALDAIGKSLAGRGVPIDL
jgi:predicted dehydrogenase